MAKVARGVAKFCTTKRFFEISPNLWSAERLRATYGSFLPVQERSLEGLKGNQERMSKLCFEQTNETYVSPRMFTPLFQLTQENNSVDIRRASLVHDVTRLGDEEVNKRFICTPLPFQNRKPTLPQHCLPLLDEFQKKSRGFHTSFITAEKPNTSVKVAPNAPNTDLGSKGWTYSKVVNAANIVSLTRLVTAPAIAWLIVESHLELAIGSLALAGFSDWLDGYFARKHKNESVLGSYLDPLADKAVIVAVAIGIGQAGLLPGWAVGTIIGRDVVLTVGAFAHRAHVQNWKWRGFRNYFQLEGSGSAPLVKPLMISKINTALQFALFGFALTNPCLGIPGDGLLEGLAYFTCATTVVSGGAYVHGYFNGTVLPRTV